MADELRVTLCVDALNQQLSGIGRYTWELARGLPAHEDVECVRFLSSSRLIDDPGRLLRGEPVYRGRGLRRTARSWMARRTLQSTIVHAPNYFLPVGADKSVTTVHDLSVFRFPETHPIARVRQFERLFEDSLNRATRIITDTETVRCELIEMFNVLPNRITAVALGVSDRFRPLSATELEPPLGKWGLTGSYGLCVSALEPRKKVLELIGAWRRLPIGLRNRLPLVLAGGGGWLNEEIKDQVAAAEAEGWLRNLGHVDEADLPRLYAGARLFIYPSTYEGFGLPPVEAMACGVPAVVADRSCLREVCGEAPKYVDPENDNEFLTTIMESLENEQWRAKAVQCGLNQAAKYTWARCIEDTVAVYRAADLD